MIGRTPPPRKRRPDTRPPESPPASDRRLVIYEDHPQPVPASHEPSDQMLCTYQCRQMVKSEFLDAFSSAEKLVSDYQSKVETLNDSLNKAEAEGKKYRDQLFQVEQELAASRGREQALQEQLLKEVKDSQEQLKKQIQLSNELEVKLQKEMSMRQKAESSAASSEDKASLLESKLKHLSDSIEREKRRLQDELVQLKAESKISASRIRADLEKMECRARSAEMESELLKERLEELEKQLSECLHQKSELEKKLTSFTMQFQDVSSSESNILVKHLQEELRNQESEVREARRLKASQENIELLKEKLIEEKRHRERAEAELLKLPEIQLSVKKLEDELFSWKKILEDIPGVSCPDDIPPKLAGLQKEVIDSMEKVGEATARLKQIEIALEAAEVDKKNAETEAALAKEKVESLILEAKHLESRLTSVTEERDQLRNTVNELRKQKNTEAGNEAVNATLVEDLESSLAKKICFIKELEITLHEQKAANDRQQNEIWLLNEKLTSEGRKIKSLEREGDRLRSEIALLESKLGHGDFSAANTKVMRMVNALGVDNEARQTIEALRSELQKANEKLQVIAELKKQSADSGQSVDSFISGKIVQLNEQIATLEKREERYKTVFADKISVFRRACCELFGYKIVMDDRQRPNGIPVTRFTLQSIYAQSDDEKLEFEYESGNTNILVNDYTKQPDVSQQIEIFVRKLNSIPAFTANLTVESFNRRTLS